MSVTPPLPPSSSPVSAVRSGRRLKVALALSLGLNLAVLGTVAGIALRGQDPDRPAPMAVRDLSFGPFTEALTHEQRRELLKGFAGKGPSLREIRAQMRQDFSAVLAELRASPFDPAAFEAVINGQSRRITDRAEAGQAALVGLVLRMPDSERGAFADRLEQSVSHRGDRSGGRDQGRKTSEKDGAGRDIAGQGARRTD